MLLSEDKLLLKKLTELVLVLLTHKPCFDMLLLFVFRHIFKVLLFGLDSKGPSLVLVYNDVHLTYL